MARARNIKPGFFANPELVELPFEYRLLFIGLWTLADREGRLEDRPTKIRMAIFPADDVDCAKGLAALEASGFVVRYVVDGQPLIEIPAFAKHQSPHHKEQASVLPPRVSGSSMKPKPEALTAKKRGTTRGTSEVEPPSQGGETALIPDSGLLIPDPLNPPPPTTTTLSETPEPPPQPPSSSGEDPIHVRAIELVVLSRKGGAALTANDPRVREWAAAGVTDAQLLTALEQAQQQRHAKSDATPINAGYLNAILAKLRAAPAERNTAWWTPDGLARRCTELGIAGPRPGETTDQVKARIEEAAHAA